MEVKPSPRVLKEWVAHGLHCRIITGPFYETSRHSNMNGYVAVPQGHPYYGKLYSQVHLTEHVHGGLTFATQGSDEPDPRGFTLWTDPELWWFGFDTSHAWDYIRYSSDCENILHRPSEPNPDEHVWSIEEVIAETESLAEQLAAIVEKDKKER